MTVGGWQWWQLWRVAGPGPAELLRATAASLGSRSADQLRSPRWAATSRRPAAPRLPPPSPHHHHHPTPPPHCLPPPRARPPPGRPGAGGRHWDGQAVPPAKVNCPNLLLSAICARARVLTVEWCLDDHCEDGRVWDNVGWVISSSHVGCGGPPNLRMGRHVIRWASADPRDYKHVTWPASRLTLALPSQNTILRVHWDLSNKQLLIYNYITI